MSFSRSKSRAAWEHVTWSLSDGKLPYGIMFSPGGVLVGTPGEAGEFTFKIMARDAHPAGPRTAEKQFTWKIGPAPSRVAAGKICPPKRRAGGDRQRTLKSPGEQDDQRSTANWTSHFWNLDQPIQKKARGTPEKRASFGAVWTADCHPYGPRPGWYELGEFKGTKCYLEGCDLILAVKVLDGPKGKTPKDGIHVFIDGNHNRSVIYSGDDTHFFIPRNHKGGWAQSLRGKVNWFTDARVQEIEGGYTMEIRLGGKQLLWR